MSEMVNKEQESQDITVYKKQLTQWRSLLKHLPETDKDRDEVGEIDQLISVLKAENEQLKELLSHKPNVCSKCGVYIGLLAESECLNCATWLKAKPVLDAALEYVGEKNQGAYGEIVQGLYRELDKAVREMAEWL